jgi:hypothetical protein
MSTKQPRKPRVNKQVEAKPAEPTPQAELPKQPEPPKQAEPEPAKPAAEPPKTESPKSEETKVKKGDAGITRARVRTHIDKFNLNKLLDAKIEEVKAEAASKNVSPDSEEYKPYKDKIKALSGERVRFSNEASVVLSIVCEELTEQLLKFAMDKNLELNDGKFIKVHHLHSAGVEQLGLFPLIKALPLFVNKKQKFDRQYQEELLKNEIKVAVSAAEKEFKKLHDIKTAKKRPAEVTPKTPAEKVPKPPAPKDPSTKTAFKAYVNGVYLSLKESSESYDKLTLSGEFKNYLSELLVEFIRRISSHIYLMTTTIKNKTVNDVVTLRAVELLLIDMHQPHETIELTLSDGKFTAEKLVTYPSSGYGKLLAAVEAKREKAKAELANHPEEEHATA